MRKLRKIVNNTTGSTSVVPKSNKDVFEDFNTDYGLLLDEFYGDLFDLIDTLVYAIESIRADMDSRQAHKKSVK